MSPDFVSSLPNLGVGVSAIAALVYITTRFLEKLDKRDDAMRELERSVRESITTHLTQASVALSENSRALERVVRFLDSR